ncbi:MAG: hypothetical protein KDK89_01050 [Alphaproteobacteria bacterium]|nr:hypothetical protein [Alphaproteobacteria bacterium]
MLDRLLAIVALAVLIGFLSIIVIWVPRIDLGAVILITVIMAVYDMAFHAHRPPSS